MKLKDVKKILDKLTAVELQQDFQFISNELCESGLVATFSKLKSDLYYSWGDDPCSLRTRKELIDDGLDKEEIEMCDLQFQKGQYVINL